MNIVFYCQSCGARFDVPPTSAGKKGRCKKCGQMMSIPVAEALASMVAMPALSAAMATAGAPEAKTGATLSWLAAAGSNVALAPLTMDNMPVGGPKRPIKPKYDDDLGDSKPYLLAEPVRPKAKASVRSSRPVGGAKMLWRRELGVVQRSFRWMNETAYLVSVPFLLLLLLGAILGSRHLALVGATAVVLLNLGRIVAGVANLAVVPFREGIVQGVMFLIPPLTFFYLANHWGKLKKPAMRIATPIATICVVFVAFTLIPSLRTDGKPVALKDIQGQFRDEARSLEGEMIGEVGKVKTIDVEGLEAKAKRTIGDAAGQINSIGQPGGAAPSSRP